MITRELDNAYKPLNRVQGSRPLYKDVTQKQADLIDLKEFGDKNKKLNNKQEKEKELHRNYKPQLISETTWSYFNEIKEPFGVSFE